MNNNITLVHNEGYKLSRLHEEQARGKVDIVYWSNQAGEEEKRRMRDAQDRARGLHTFPCYIYDTKPYKLHKVCYNEQGEVIKSESFSIKGKTRASYDFPNFNSFMEYYNSLEQKAEVTEKYIQFLLPATNQTVDIIDPETEELIETKEMEVLSEHRVFRIYDKEHEEEVFANVGQIKLGRKERLAIYKSAIEETEELLASQAQEVIAED